MRRPMGMSRTLQPLAEMEKEAVLYIRKALPPNEVAFLGFSGGKDSIVTYKLMEMSGVPFQAYYSATGIDFPSVVGFIRRYYPDVIHLRPPITFWEGIRKNRPPTQFHRWCCDVLKKKAARSIPLTHRFMGIRAEESTKRAKRERSVFLEKWKITHHKPIFFFKEWHVWEFIEKYDLPYPDLYDSEGMDRIGCVVCPYTFGDSKAAVASRVQRERIWPGAWVVFKKSCKEWFDSQKLKGAKYPKEADFEEWYSNYLNDRSYCDGTEYVPNSFHLNLRGGDLSGI